VRILLTHHFPLDRSRIGKWVADLAVTLRAAEHDVRIVCVGECKSSDGLPLRTIGCNRADSKFALPFDLPWFGIEPEGPTTFESLASEAITEYRDVLRHELDVEVDEFNPQIIHCQHVWLWGQLALETGVPYVLSAWGPELVCRARDERYRALADQAAENASRIFVADEHIRREVLDTFEDVAARTLLLPDAVDPGTLAVLLDAYERVLDERFGT
jgi:hypothetical protein